MIVIWMITFLLRTGLVHLQDVPNATFRVVKIGDNVTIECYLPQKSITTMVWYKQDVGKNLRPVALVYNYLTNIKYEEEFQNGRFNILPNRASFHLNIIAINQKDSGTYYCGIMFLNQLQFVSWTFLMPTETESKMRTIIKQPISESGYPGDSVTLQCTVFTESCSEDHSVYWFRHGSGEFHPGNLYTHVNSDDQCKKTSETGSTTQSCVYKLPKTNLSLSDTGTYYCAVAACGEILFGNGTALKTIDTSNENDWDPIAFGFACTNIFSVTVIIALVFDLCNNWRTNHKGSTNHLTDQPQTPSTTLLHSDDLYYAAVRFIPDHSASKKARRKTFKDLPVYAEVSSNTKN